MAWPFKTSSLLFLILAGLLLTDPATAETITGRVDSIEENSFVLQESKRQETKISRRFQVVYAPKTHGQAPPDNRLPRCVRLGKTVRIQGELDMKTHKFHAQEIHGWPGMGKHHHDPTGVRARLGRCRKNQIQP